MSPTIVTVILICSNCDTNPVGPSLKYCFNDWCKSCDDSLWTSEDWPEANPEGDFTDDQKNTYDINRLNR